MKIVWVPHRYSEVFYGVCGRGGRGGGLKGPLRILRSLVGGEKVMKKVLIWEIKY
tara:strand:+ start:457 stop:621 length:165 start_codon:yes stop_codon:yes gene_type:complete